MRAMRIRIRDGKAQFVYDDALVPVAEAMGKMTVERASHVEPASTYCGGCNRPFPCACGEPKRPVASYGWVADMAPVGGPLLGTYLSRQEALDAEREWLREHRGL